MKGYLENIEKLTLENNDYRRVLYTGKHMQLVLMSIEPGDEIGAETHTGIDQFIRIESGVGKVVIDGEASDIADDDVVIIPAGALHNVINTGDSPLKPYSLYGPPEHRHDVVHPTKADETEEHFDGVTSE